MLLGLAALERNLETGAVLLKQAEVAENIELVLQLCLRITCRDLLRERDKEVASEAVLRLVVIANLVFSHLKVNPALLGSETLLLSSVEKRSLYQHDCAVRLLAFGAINAHDTDLLLTSSKLVLQEHAKLAKCPIAEDDDDSVGSFLVLSYVHFSGCFVVWL
jgi:hypothetical protein